MGNLLERFKFKGKKKRYLKASWKLRDLGLPTLVSFPRYAEDSDPTHINPASLPGLIETYQKLKTNMSVIYGRELKAVLVSSPETKGGSTWVTSGFAVTMARYNSHKVILIDANLRNQGLYQWFDVPKGNGLSELIQEKADLDNVIKKSKVPNLSIITGGKDYTDPTLIFESHRWRDIINELKQRFDWIIIDSSPINSYADTILMAPHVDGVILLIQAEKTQIDAALQAKEWLEKTKVKIIGVVINKKRYVLDKDMETRYGPKSQVSYVKPRELEEGGAKNMKLQATYSKNANGSIEVTIKVVDKGDFPTVNIFNSASENPLDEAWNLGEGKESTISKTLASTDEAKQWALLQVKVLREKLDQWRNIEVPETEEFEV